MTLARFKELAALPAILVGMLVALGYLLSLQSTGKRLGDHVVQESTVHRRDFAARRRTDSAVAELDEHAEDLGRLVEALIRGECIENPTKDLARQGLLAKCRALGITP